MHKIRGCLSKDQPVYQSSNTHNPTLYIVLVCTNIKKSVKMISDAGERVVE